MNEGARILGYENFRYSWRLSSPLRKSRTWRPRTDSTRSYPYCPTKLTKWTPIWSKNSLSVIPNTCKIQKNLIKNLKNLNTTLPQNAYEIKNHIFEYCTYLCAIPIIYLYRFLRQSGYQIFRINLVDAEARLIDCGLSSYLFPTIVAVHLPYKLRHILQYESVHDARYQADAVHDDELVVGLALSARTKSIELRGA